ncbi:MAG: hypothetical protein U0V48_14310 [Anaerolineales bacterium]
MVVLPLHIEFAFIGWMVQLAMGVAFWILPRLSHGSPRGNEKFIWAAFALLNTGIFLVVIQNLFGVNGSAFIGRIMELLGLAAFAAGNWNGSNRSKINLAPDFRNHPSPRVVA